MNRLKTLLTQEPLILILLSLFPPSYISRPTPLRAPLLPSCSGDPAGILQQDLSKLSRLATRYYDGCATRSRSRPTTQNRSALNAMDGGEGADSAMLVVDETHYPPITFSSGLQWNSVLMAA